MLARIRELASQRANFAFEITLAGRSFAPWIEDLINDGYAFHLLYLWLPTPELAVARVAQRVRAGGHDVPPDTVRRRYRAGLVNFRGLYHPRGGYMMPRQWLVRDWRRGDRARTP